MTGFPLTIRDDRIDRTEFLLYLNEKGIDTRLLFTGNITKQPYFLDYQIKHRTVSALKNTDTIMNDTFWVGVYHGLEKMHFDYMSQCFMEYLEKFV